MRRSGVARAPLSFAQERLWFLDRLEPGAAAYTTLSALRFRGALDAAILERSLREVVRRHEALRTTFGRGPEGEPVQVIGPEDPWGPAGLPALAEIDLGALPAGRRAAEASRVAARETGRGFDLGRGPLLRASLLRLARVDGVLLIAVHHIATDGLSSVILEREISRLYDAFASGRPSPLPALPCQYADFALWQRRRLETAALAGEVDYWRRRLAGLPALCLTGDRPRPETISSRGARHAFVLPVSLGPAFRGLCRHHEVTLFMALLAGFLALLSRYSGQDDLVVGLPVANRTRAELEALIGFFVNTLVLRTDLAGDPTVAELLERVRETAIGAFAHQEAPLELLAEELRPARDLSRNPLFQVMFNLQSLGGPSAAWPAVAEVQPEVAAKTPRPAAGEAAPVLALAAARRTAICDLACDLWETPVALTGQMEYSTDLFDAATVARLAGHLANLLAGLAARPAARVSELPLLSPEERAELMSGMAAATGAATGEAGAVAAPGAASSIASLVRGQAQRRGAAPAVIWGDEVLTYAELDRQAGELARRLLVMGVGPEDAVGLCLERTPSLLVALLGVLAAGAAFLPLDPAHPPERLVFQLTDARARLVLTERPLLAALSAAGVPALCLDGDDGLHLGGSSQLGGGLHLGEGGHLGEAGHLDDLSPVFEPEASHPERLAYVIYTSGSSGRPKPVMVPAGALLNHALAMTASLRLSAADRLLQLGSIAFDVALEEILPAWMAGAAVVLPPPGGPMSVVGLGAWLEQAAVSVANLPAAFFHEWVRHLSRSGKSLPASLRLVVTGSERVAPAAVVDWRRIAGGGISLIHAYGVTEATVTSLLFPVPASQDAAQEAWGLPVGRPIAGLRAAVLDRHGNPQPVGAPGELWLGGRGLARGYFGRPELTAESFRPDPFAAEPGERLYRTGDLARRLPTDDLHLLGRIDQQMKLRGIRIEPGEIEGVLAEHPDVAECAVALREAALGDPRLVAYVVLRPGARLATADLRRFLGGRLPLSLVPSELVPLAALPRLPGGKLDRRRLPEPSSRRPDTGTAFVAPRAGLARQIAAVWQELLGVDEVGMDDNFFDLGGRSLLLIRVHERLCEQLSRELRLLDLFHYPTVGALAAHLAGAPHERRKS